MSRNETNHKKKASLLSIIPGLGQFYNKQAFKGIVFFALFLVFAIEMALTGFQALEGLITLGSVPRDDHSLFLMIKGTLQLILSIIFLFFYILNILDARKIGALRDRGEKN
jgi:arabinogalactan oligomer/maltooligosaccharide transport system permease protein